MALELFPIMNKVSDLYKEAALTIRVQSYDSSVSRLLGLIEIWDPQHNGKSVLDAEAKRALAVLITKLAVAFKG